MASPKTDIHVALERSIANDAHCLTEEEKRQLFAVLQKAKEFEEEEENQMKKPVEGQLYKYTNVVKGWQFRWFILTPETGMLEYYMMDESRKNRPKGGLHLAGAIILPSEDDSHSFTVSAMCGEVYKLKASDSRERQFWVNRLRATAVQHTGSPVEIPNINRKVHRSLSQSLKEISPVDYKFSTVSESCVSKSAKSVPADHGDSAKSVVDLNDQLLPIKECVENATSSQKALASIIEQLPIDGPHLKCSDSALLLLKATSQATVQSLEYCYLILQKMEHEKMLKCLPSNAAVQWANSKKLMNDSSKK